MDLKAVGISYHNAPLEVRELVALSEEESRTFLFRLKETFDLNEALVVSTCNRTEIYYTSNDDLATEIISLLGVHKSINSDILHEHFNQIGSGRCIQHLFEVALGLDSKVLGDIQISNQVKKAYQASADLELASPFLHRLMHTIFYANKRVVQETALQDGNASVASVSVDLVKRFIENISSPKIALIGLGEIGQNVLENLGKIDASVSLVNRTRAKAEKLAVSDNVEIVSFDEKEEAIKDSDVVIVAIAGEEKIIDSEFFEASEFHHKLLIDLSVPRVIPTETGSVSGITLYNVDQLSEKTEKVKSRREASIPDVRQIIQEALAGFEEWREEVGVSPTIQKLKNTLDEIRRQELARHAGKISDKEMKLLEVVTKSMIQKVIKLPVIQLKAACRRGESDSLVGVLNDLFNLEPDKVRND